MNENGIYIDFDRRKKNQFNKKEDHAHMNLNEQSVEQNKKRCKHK